jgi:hypothetical protein
MVAFGRLLPYDATRNLLLVRENGQNESGTHDAALSAAYPDNSLIWLDAATGRPLGVAHVFGVHPVTVTGQGSQDDYYHEWGMDQDVEGKRALYAGHKNTILRWAPKAEGGWEATPTCAWVEPTVGASDCSGEPLDGSTSGDGNQSIRWREFHVTGAGTNTVIFAGGGTWRAGCQPQMFKTTDGLKFKPVARLDDRNNGAAQNSYALGGQVSHAVQYGWDATRPNLITAYSGHYPGTGYGARPNRYQTDLDNPESVLFHSYAFNEDGNVAVMKQDEVATNGIPVFSWEAAGKDGLTENHLADGLLYYDGNWSCNLDANKEVDYIVNYSMPSWNNQFSANGTNVFKPGWVAVHRLDGSIAANSAWKLPCTEMDAQTPDEGTYTGNAWGYCGDVTIVPDTNAPANLKKSTVYWNGGAYGYGVFTVQNVAASIVSEPQDQSIGENAPLTITAEISGSPNIYQWYKDGVALDPAKTNADGTLYYPKSVVQGANKATLYVSMAGTKDSGKYKLVATNPLGSVTTREAVITVVNDTVAPTITSSTVGRTPSISYIRVDFSEQVTAETAGDANNYKLSGGINVTSAQAVSSTAAVVYCDPLATNTTYTLTVNGVKDISSNANTIAANTQVTIKGPLYTKGVILWEYYPGITGTSVGDLEGSGFYPDMPSRWAYMNDWSTDDNGLSNYAEAYGARASGWLTPTETASYRFFVGSDDACMLYLNRTGPSTDPGNVESIAWENGCCQSFAEPDAADPEGNGSKLTSDAIPLTAGQSYYMYLVLKEGGGGDWFKVAWRKEGSTNAASSLLAIPGSFMSAYAPAPVPKFNAPVLANGVLTISWTGTGTLLESTNLTDWAVVPGSPTSPYTVTNPSGATRFYRLQQ